ncbi:hypothetical protein BU23DRAFT_658629 [Bimuria novae-zelandiae CBS 107.79]|uniref:Uncharacterized protein n=1 Tax=Bimuria novae-zelandiae CBS 107.79 TaxID=1447943 RepID=A0A6A5UR79_9PLEO|nr:hypothetical protein BU23DRAFT_658629 [Bimuria novae-zelandiae CBS 107.79]
MSSNENLPSPPANFPPDPAVLENPQDDLSVTSGVSELALGHNAAVSDPADLVQDDEVSDEQPVEEEVYEDLNDEDDYTESDTAAYQYGPDQNSDEDPDARYEELGLDRKYFNHDYYLKYHSLAPEVAAEDAAENPGQVNSSSDGAKPSPKKNSPKKNSPKKNKMVSKKSWKGIADTVEEQADAKPKKNGPVRFHEDEITWFHLFYKKIKAVINSGKEIQLPSDALLFKLFNEEFEGKVLYDSEVEPLSPHKPRHNATLHKRVGEHADAKLRNLREEVSMMLEDSVGDQLSPAPSTSPWHGPYDDGQSDELLRTDRTPKLMLLQVIEMLLLALSINF